MNKKKKKEIARDTRPFHIYRTEGNHRYIAVPFILVLYITTVIIVFFVILNNIVKITLYSIMHLQIQVLIKNPVFVSVLFQ